METLATYVYDERKKQTTTNNFLLWYFGAETPIQWLTDSINICARDFN